MSDAKADKKNESINALKNANKHLADLFADLFRKETVLSTCSSDLTYIARQCGEIQIKYYIGTQLNTGSLKAYLEAIAKNLEGAR